MTTRRTTCSCGQLHLTIEGEPSRISMCGGAVGLSALGHHKVTEKIISAI